MIMIKIMTMMMTIITECSAATEMKGLKLDNQMRTHLNLEPWTLDYDHNHMEYDHNHMDYDHDHMDYNHDHMDYDHDHMECYHNRMEYDHNHGI